MRFISHHAVFFTYPTKSVVEERNEVGELEVERLTISER